MSMAAPPTTGRINHVTIANGGLAGKWYRLDDHTATNPILSQRGAKPGTARFRATGQIAQRPKMGRTRDPLMGEEIEIVIYEQAYVYEEIAAPKPLNKGRKSLWLCADCSTRGPDGKWSLPPMTREAYDAHILEVHEGDEPVGEFSGDEETEYVDPFKGRDQVPGFSPSQLGEAAAPLGMHPDAAKSQDDGISETVLPPGAVKDEIQVGVDVTPETPVPPGSPAQEPIDIVQELADSLGITREELAARVTTPIDDRARLVEVPVADRQIEEAADLANADPQETPSEPTGASESDGTSAPVETTTETTDGGGGTSG